MPDLDALSREELVALIRELLERVATLEKENEALRAQLSSGRKGNVPPPFVKPNRQDRPQGQRRERKKRTQSFVRKSEEPTREITHALEHCPDCGRRLEGGWRHSVRQTIEIPQEPFEIIEHVIYARWCGICGKRQLPKLGPSDGVVGQHRVGPRLMSLIVTLSKVCRVPVRKIQTHLQSLYGLHLATGEISEVLHAVAAWGKGEADHILAQLREAPVIHGDETSWREDGLNGNLWSFSTPLLRYFEIVLSRAAAVAKHILEGFTGTLVTDFYAAYNWYEGPHSRCWVHLLRDVKALREEHADEADVVAFADGVISVYRDAKGEPWHSRTQSARCSAALAYEERLLALARPYAKDLDSPMHALSWRVERYHKELFTWVRDPAVPSDNNPAERALRPSVIGRKVSGGTRSERGSRTTSVLLTLLGTWTVQDKDPLAECQRLLTTVPQPAPT